MLSSLAMFTQSTTESIRVGMTIAQNATSSLGEDNEEATLEQTQVDSFNQGGNIVFDRHEKFIDVLLTNFWVELGMFCALSAVGVRRLVINIGHRIQGSLWGFRDEYLRQAFEGINVGNRFFHQVNSKFF